MLKKLENQQRNKNKIKTNNKIWNKNKIKIK
jgi:hypothetical protein